MKHLLFITAILLLTLKAQAQNVGIGTTSPLQKLHVEGATFLNGNVGIAINNPIEPLHVNGVSLFTPGGSNIQILDGNKIQAFANGGLNLTTYSNDPIKFTTNTSGGGFGGERMRILSNGKVGIGTSTPGSMLHVVSGASGYVGDYFSGITLESNGDTYFNLLVPNSNETGVLFGKASDAASCGIVYNHTETLNGLQFRTNGYSTRMVLDQNGNVGIGNTSPEFLLDLNNRMRIRSGGSVETSAGVWLNKTDNSVSQAFVGVENDSYVGIYGSVPGWSFGMNTTNGNVKVMGRLGIGTTSPAASLEVNGYTKLGSDAPSMKVKKLTGTTAVCQGCLVNIPSGLSASKILSVSVMVEYTTGDWLCPNYGFGYNFVWEANGGNIMVSNVLSGSANILSKPIRILITYEE